MTISINKEEETDMIRTNLNGWYYSRPFFYHKNKYNTWEVYSKDELPEDVKEYFYGR